ncbi:hypothetical protein MKW94_024763 [Papaver nudicaule]|uniref:Transcription elongation factor SPT5 n=1 Tax=Papaver nudicaule TaxID=74823 RepID=A0AA41VM62_PAPNU|nr:hypothetical protein [Papaver nudicaule]
MARNKTLVQSHDEDQEDFSEEELHGSKTMAARSGRSHGGGGDSSRKRRRSIFIDDVAEEADDDSEEEEEEDDYDEQDYYGKSKKKRRHNSAKAFIDDQATVATDEEESTEGELGDEPFIVSNEEIVPDDGVDGRMGHGHRPQLFDDKEIDIEEFEKRIYQRYNNLHEEEIDEAEIDDVEQQSLLPSVTDPKLWTVKCAVGREREAALCLMQKCIDRAPGMNICSAIALDYLQNYIYVEADKESHVREACKGLRMLDTRIIRLVPIKEMTAVVSPKGKATDIVKDMWVRMKVGIYKGDIAKAVSEPDMRRRVMVKLIPRVDLQAVADKLQGNKVSKRSFVPSPHLINLDAARNLNIPVVSRRNGKTGISFDVVDGNTYSDGYLYKTVSIKSIDYGNIKPTFDELQRFREPGHGDGCSALSASLENSRQCPFRKGDAVIVVEGDLKTLTGRVERVEDYNLHIKPESKDLHTTVAVNAKYVCKYFKVGGHVKVVSGAHEGSAGTVIKVDGHKLILISDATREDICVFAEHVVDSSEVTSGATTRIEDYELHDLVMLADMSFGVIIRLERESLQVLKGDPDRPEVALVKLRDIKYKIDQRRCTAQDRNNSTVSVKDVVKILKGPCQGKQGPVEHIHKGTLFIKDRHHKEHSGFICVKAQSCIVMGGSNSKLVSPPSKCATSRHTAYIPPSPRRYSRGPQSDSGGRHGGVRLRGSNSFVGSTIKIRVGPYKGCRGRVVSFNGQLVQVELESQMQTITVKREEISADAFSETTRQSIGSETPMHRPQTPLHPCMTPMRDQGGQTPLHIGMRTPMRHQAWNPCAVATPARGTSPAPTYNSPALTTGSGWD